MKIIRTNVGKISKKKKTNKPKKINLPDMPQGIVGLIDVHHLCVRFTRIKNAFVKLADPTSVRQYSPTSETMVFRCIGDLIYILYVCIP